MNHTMRHLLRRIVPNWWRPTLDAAAVLAFDLGHLRTANTRACVDGTGAPIPWYTYPVIEYLRQLDFSEADVFEYGSGHSTLFWGSRAKSVTSVEDDRDWYEKLRPRLQTNCTLILETDLYEYPRVIERGHRRYDVVVVDGASRGNTRLKCARRALAALREGGLVVLDNADWLPESARLLREGGLIQVDMAGFGPVNGYTWTTSLFLHREFAPRPLAGRQPGPAVGSWPQTWETPPFREPPIVECGDDVFGGVMRNQLFTFPGPHASEHFRLVVAERRNAGVRSVAVLDERRQRVLISFNEPVSGPAVMESRLERILSSGWPEFMSFVNSNDQRRYDLAPTSPNASGEPPADR